MKRFTNFFQISLAALVLSLALVTSPALRAQDPAPTATPAQETKSAAETVKPEETDTREFEGNTRKIRKKTTNNRRDKRMDVVQIGNDVTIPKGQTVPEVVVVFGNAKVDGDVDRDLVVVGGDVTLDGKVGRSVVAVLGNVHLGPNAEVDREIVAVGGNITKDPAAIVHGQETAVSIGRDFGGFSGLGKFFRGGLLLGRPIAPTVGIVWVVIGMFFFAYLMTALIVPRAVEATVEVLDKKPISAFFMGILLMVLAGPTLLLLMVSIVGILAIPFLICAAFAGMLIGKASILRFLGLQVATQTGANALKGIIGSMFIGMLVLVVAYMIPLLGIVVWGVTVPLALGTAFMAGMGILRPTPPAPPIPQPVFATANATTMEGAAAGSPPPFEGTIPNPSSASPGIPPLPITLPRAGFWLRVGATFLDFIMLVFVLVHSGPFFIFLWGGYHIVLWTLKGTTVGGIIVGLKVIRLDGGQVTFAVSAVRALASVLSFCVFGLGFFWASWDKDRQSWHDKIAGTTIVKVPRGMSLV